MQTLTKTKEMHNLELNTEFDFNPEGIKNKQELLDDQSKQHLTSENLSGTKTSDSGHLEKNIRLTILPKFFEYRERKIFKCIKKWEGVIKEVHSDNFIADLYELDQDIPETEAEIPFEEISPKDRELVQVGASFYWNIYYVDSYTGRERSSKFIFHRSPILTNKMHSDIFEKAMKKYDTIHD